MRSVQGHARAIEGVRQGSVKGISAGMFISGEPASNTSYYTKDFCFLEYTINIGNDVLSRFLLLGRRGQTSLWPAASGIGPWLVHTVPIPCFDALPFLRHKRD